MSGSTSGRPPTKVLVIEDEKSLAQLYQEWLSSEYEVGVVYSGDDAFEATVQEEWDAILLDRRMPGISGDEVLDRLRDAGNDLPVAMVTAVEPDFDIIELGFDDYIVKPVSKQDLHDTVQRLLDLGTYDAAIQRYYSLASTKAALEVNKTADELQNSTEYQQLQEELEEVEKSVDDRRDIVFGEDGGRAVFNDRFGSSQRNMEPTGQG